MNKSFSLAGLEFRLGELRSSGFSFSTDFSQSTRRGLVFLRHDVDLSLHRALDVAKLESRIGVQSTFFFLVSSDLYNLSSRASGAILDEIRDLGHQVGLHFDISAGSESQVLHRLNNELELLGSLTKSPIRYFSQHKPTTYGFVPLRHGSAIDVREQTVADGSCVTYCSDSGGFWSHGDYVDRGLRPDAESLQLLLHPIWWASESSKHPMDALCDFLEDAGQFLETGVALNVKRFGNALETGEGKSAWPENIR